MALETSPCWLRNDCDRPLQGCQSLCTPSPSSIGSYTYTQQTKYSQGSARAPSVTEKHLEKDVKTYQLREAPGVQHVCGAALSYSRR